MTCMCNTSGGYEIICILSCYFKNFHVFNDIRYFLLLKCNLSHNVPPTSEEQAPEGEDQGNAPPLEQEEDIDGLWEETFKSHTDSKPHGPSSVGMDISFVNSNHVYGIPEHADSFSLKETTWVFPFICCIGKWNVWMMNWKIIIMYDNFTWTIHPHKIVIRCYYYFFYIHFWIHL